MKIGIIGGGQLGQMIAEVAKMKEYEVIVLDPNKKCPASFIADEVIEGSLTSLNDIETLCRKSDIITYEFENIPYEIVRELEEKYNIPQGHKPLMYSQNRIREKDYVKSCNVNVGDYKKITSYTQLLEELKEIKFPSVLKTTTDGYDGKGQVVLKSKNDLNSAKELIETKECILEEFINYDYEISICIARSNTEEYIFPIPNKNIHKNNILYKVDCTEYLNNEITKKASNFGLAIMKKENLIGIMVFEFFVKGNEVYFNEMAPRPHNSYHYGIDATNICQFGGLIKAIMNQTIKPEKEVVKNSVMFNLLGEDMKGFKNYLKENNIDIGDDLYVNIFNKKSPRAKIRLYGKEDSKVGRKMGHITFINNDKDELKKDVKNFESR